MFLEKNLYTFLPPLVFCPGSAPGGRGTMVVPVGVSGGEVKMGGGPGFDLGVLM